MSKYDELCKALSDHNEASRDYWQTLQMQAAQIAAGLWKYLEYPSQSYAGHAGEGFLPYILLTRPGEEKGCQFLDLPGKDGAIQFDVIITVEVEQNHFPKTRLRYSFNIGKSGQVLKVWDVTGNITAEFPVENPDFEYLYEQIFLAIRTWLKARPSMQ